ncbi:MAG: DNA starvation/stationary phase protection protein Dps [Fimbriiglobus sp.]
MPATPKLFATRHDLPADTRAKLVDLLNQQLADTFDLRTQVKHAHWNVKGRNFIALHELFDEQVDRLDELVDDIAERATALGGVAHGPAKAVAKATRLPEFPADVFDGLAVVAVVADRFAAVAKSSRAAIDAADELGDKDTADLFTAASRALDKDLWFLEAHLQAES